MSCPPHFFQFPVFPPHQGIRIPIKFMRKYGRDLQKTVKLKVPNGASWQLGLVNGEDGTWIQKGWNEFAKFYSIKDRHFLVFRYEGNSQFHVLIFDPSTLEIEYPFKDQLTDFDVSVEILDKFEGNQQDGSSVELISGIKKMNKRLNAKNVSKTYQRAKTFKSENPFFTSFMHPSYVSPPSPLTVSLGFMRKHLTISGKQIKVYLRVCGSQEERIWEVICRVYKDSANFTINSWKEFVCQNNLKEGDSCVFELECVSTKLFNVFIYRAD